MKFNVGDKVRCVALEKIPSDGANYCEIGGLKIGNSYEVSHTQDYYQKGHDEIEIVTVSGGSCYWHLASNFVKVGAFPYVDEQERITCMCGAAPGEAHGCWCTVEDDLPGHEIWTGIPYEKEKRYCEEHGLYSTLDGCVSCGPDAEGATHDVASAAVELYGCEFDARGVWIKPYKS